MIPVASSNELPSTTGPRTNTDVAPPGDMSYVSYTPGDIDGEAVDGPLENKNEDIEEESQLIS